MSPGTAPLSADFWHDAAMPYVESRRACASRACYKSHHHPTYSIGAVDAGHSVFVSAGHAPVSLRAGSVVFIPPQRVHACNPAPGTAWSYQMLHIDAIWLTSLQRETGYAGDTVQPVRVAHNGSIYQRLCSLNTILFSRASVSEKDAALVEFLGDWQFDAQLMLLPAEPAAQQAPVLEIVMDYLRSQPGTVPALQQLASLAGMSRYQLIRLFRAHTGLPPHAWHLNHRINLARDYLRQGSSLAEVAYRLGFADQSHFQRVFKAHTGVTPGSYRS